MLGLGANVGDPGANLLAAIRRLSRDLGPLRVAPLYRTSPVSDVPQPDFLNTVVAAVTERTPRELLRLAKELETRAGRRAGPRWGPRPLDVDLLVVGAETLDDEDLRVPHPGIPRRAFVLRPLADLAPGLEIPGAGRTAAELLAAFPPGEQSVERVGWSTAIGA